MHSMIMRRSFGGISRSLFRRDFSSKFPSLTIRASELIPRGSFAEAQAAYLKPDEEAVRNLDELLRRNNIGVVAHFYMDPELQGILQKVSWPHVFIADSLAMGDAALKMARHGVNSCIVLGVDFMSENVQATLRHEGFPTPVYRLSEKHIGCSLAESAEGKNYQAFLQQACKTPNSLHVVYINTSLQTKAKAHNLVPTITCTSSNVVNTILQASAQIPDVNIWFGPDTYMGENLVRTFQHLSSLSDAEISKVHAQHSRLTINSLISRFNYYKQGNCIVHHMFDERVTQHLLEHHNEDFLTAHLEVPGAMFTQSLLAQSRGRGKVGSTSDILGFITSKVAEAVASSPQSATRLSFVLGTEAGMITGIVAQVQRVLQSVPSTQVEAEIIFPVSTAAISAAPDSALAVVPGVSSGEGCSSAGGCATCPFMKMNTIDALLQVANMCGEKKLSLNLAKFGVQQRFGQPLSLPIQLGVVPINHMRVFQTSKQLGADLIHDVMTRNV